METPEGCAAQCNLDPCCKGFSKAPLSEKCWLKSAECANPDTSISWDWYDKLLDTSSLCGPAGAPPPAPAAANVGGTPVAVSATGDPHMQNMLGQRFDLMQAGNHVLLQIPRSAIASASLLRVQASAEHDGDACADMYFKTLNISGDWADERQIGGYAYTAEIAEKHLGWQTFGKIDLKVAWGRTPTGTKYLNFYVRHLKQVEHEVGGILGMDDYHLAAKPTAACTRAHVSLLESSKKSTRESSVGAADM